MIYLVLWVVAVTGLARSWYWGENRVPPIMGTKGQSALFIGTFFGLIALEADVSIRGGYFNDFGEVDVAAQFFVKPIGLFVYCFTCPNLIGVSDA